MSPGTGENNDLKCIHLITPLLRILTLDDPRRREARSRWMPSTSDGLTYHINRVGSGGIGSETGTGCSGSRTGARGSGFESGGSGTGLGFGGSGLSGS